MDLSENVKDLQIMEPIFKGVKFYASGEVPENVLKLLTSGQAERMNYFSDYVTHLICGKNADENDLSDANDLYEIPAIVPKWIYMCARLRRLVNTKPYIYDNNKLFSNLTFCLSKVEKDRASIWSLITYHGGIVQLNLDKSCTHLVTGYTGSAKYGRAASLGPERIAIVTPDWIVESVRNKSLAQADLFHPKLIRWPKAIKHESTTSITGFEPDHQPEPKGDVNVPDSTQALLERLKERMPWNQSTMAPPNLAQNFAKAEVVSRSQAQMRMLQQVQPEPPQLHHQVPQAAPFSSQANMLPTNQPRSIVHHPAQTTNLIGQPQLGNLQQQFVQPVMHNQANQLVQNRLIQQQQQQQQQRATIQNLARVNPGQFAQQLIQRTQLEQGAQTPTPQPQFAINQQQVIQRSQMGKAPIVGMPQGVQLQHGVQINRQQLVQGQIVQQVTTQAQLTPQQVIQNRLAQNQQFSNLQQIQQLHQNKIIQNQFPQGNVQSQPQVIQQQQVINTQFANNQVPNSQQQLFNQNQHFNAQQQQQNFGQINQMGQGNQQQGPQQVVPQQQTLGSQVGPQQTIVGQQTIVVPQQSQQGIVGQQQNIVGQQQTILGQQVMSGPQQGISGPQQGIVGQQQVIRPQQTIVGQQQVQFAPQQNQPGPFGAQQGLINQQQVPQQLINQQQIINQQQQQLSSPMQQQQMIAQQGQQQQQQQQMIAQQGQQQQMIGQQGQQQQQMIAQQGQQLVNQQQLLNQQQMVQQQQANQQILINQQGQIPPQNAPQFIQQQNQPNQPNQQRPIAQQLLWQQQQQLAIRHQPAGIIQQQGTRVQWSPNQQQQQQGILPQRQYIQLDQQTHQQLQAMPPEQRALFIAKIQQRQRQIILQRQAQMQQQQRTGQILIRSGPVPQGLNPQQQMQWLQQQAKQQGVVLQSNIQQQQQQPPPSPAPGNLPQNIQHAPGLSPLQQNVTFTDQNQQIQLQRQQYRLQQLQMQREQAQKTAQGIAQPPSPAPVIRPIGQPQTVDVNVTVVDSNVPQQPLVVNAKTKTALANMLSIRLQSGGSTVGPVPENIGEPSAAGTLRLMTAQHNAALNSTNRPQDILALQRRVISGPNGELIRPPAPPSAPPVVQGEPPKLQYSPRATVPLQHRPGPFYGHNPNLKLPPDLFLLGCIFVVVELERFLEESFPEWQQRIEKHGGEVEKQYCNRVTHVLCETQRHGVVMQALRDCKRCVTLYWLSDVIKRKQVLPPWTALHLPTMYLDTTPALKHLISLTGFIDTDRTRVKSMIKYIGATFTNYFSKHNTLLVAARPDGQKYLRAKKWGIPVVNIQWLTDVMLGNFSTLNQMDHLKYTQFSNPPVLSFDPMLVTNLMHAWKMPINISQDSYERVKRSASPVMLPKKAKKMKTENVDENENEDMPQHPSYRILFSMIGDVDEAKRIVRQLGGTLARDHYDCTHLVMPQLARSFKLLHCVCLGRFVLPESWLRDSHAAGKFLDESSYSLDTKDFNSQFRCDFNQTLMTKNRNRLFEGKYFYITPSVFPSKRVLAELIQNCGGFVERNRRSLVQIESTNVNSPYSYIILTHGNDLHLVGDVLKNKKDQIRIVCNAEFILSAILKQTFEVEPYTVQFRH